MKKISLLLIVIGILSACVCAKDADVKKGATKMDSLTITSTAFKHMQPIPSQYTCDGADLSPPLVERTT